VLSLARSLEAAVFKNHRSETNQAYKRRIQLLYLNIKDKKNPGLRKRVISGELSIERLATMESSEMASEERKKEDQAMQKENIASSMMPKAERSFSDQLRCGKCGQKKVSYTQAQTRSADEPMTTVSLEYASFPRHFRLIRLSSSVIASTAVTCGRFVLL